MAGDWIDIQSFASFVLLTPHGHKACQSMHDKFSDTPRVVCGGGRYWFYDDLMQSAIDAACEIYNNDRSVKLNFMV